jgi:hypothetical protein
MSRPGEARAPTRLLVGLPLLVGKLVDNATHRIFRKGIRTIHQSTHLFTIPKFSWITPGQMLQKRYAQGKSTIRIEAFCSRHRSRFHSFLQMILCIDRRFVHHHPIVQHPGMSSGFRGSFEGKLIATGLKEPDCARCFLLQGRASGATTEGITVSAMLFTRDGAKCRR